MYAVVLVVLSCLLAPWIFLALQQWGGALARYPFRRVFNRVLLVVALIGMWPLLRALGVRGLGNVGFGPVSAASGQFIWGLLFGLGSLGLAAELVFLLGGRSVRVFEAGQLWVKCGQFALTGLAVAVVEETFFRGGIQNALARSMRMIPALVLASAIYSVVHFLKPKAILILPEQVTWLTGFDYLGQVLVHSAQAEGMGRGFISLWLAGMVLGSALVWTRSLYVSIGLHAGWVFMLKLFAWITQSHAELNSWWSSASLVDSIVVWPVLLALWGLLWWRCRPHLV